MQEAQAWLKRIRENPNFTLIQQDASRQGYYAITKHPTTGVEDRLWLTGITRALADRFWPKYKYISLKSIPKPKAIGNNAMAIATVGKTKTKSGRYIISKQVSTSKYRASTGTVQSKSNGVITTNGRKTMRAWRAEALERGSIVHEQVGKYARFLVNDPKTCQTSFQAWLLVDNHTLHQAAYGLICSFLNESGSARFVPIWSELVVADLPGIRSGIQHPWATAADLVLYDVDRNCLLLGELKVASGVFNEGKNCMEKPLQFLVDSPLNQACVQLAITMRLFECTYPELVTSYQPLMGVVIMTRPDGKEVTRHFLDTVDARRITDALGTIGWITKGRTPAPTVTTTKLNLKQMREATGKKKQMNKLHAGNYKNNPLFIE